MCSRHSSRRPFFPGTITFGCYRAPAQPDAFHVGKPPIMIRHRQVYRTVAAIACAAFIATATEARYRGTDPVCVTGISANDTLNVRSANDAQSRIVGRLAPDACGFNVESVEGNWTFVRGTDHQGQNIEGWVNNRYLSKASPGDAAASGFPIAAASGGGVVRRGPSVKYDKITSTKEFEPITVVRNAGVDMGGYPWFEIRFRGGIKGYQWGGIICSTETPFAGTFDKCDNFRASLSGNTPPPPTAAEQRHVTYSCNEGIPLIVTFVDRDDEHYALYSHDSGPKNRVNAVPTGSGFAYTNGFHELRGKGKNIDLIEGGNTLDRCTSQ